MLRRRKIAGTLYLGIAEDAVAPELLTAHAWLRCGDVILTGESECEHFSMVSCFAG
jgi:Transglutaminase-like superfamily